MEANVGDWCGLLREGRVRKLLRGDEKLLLLLLLLLGRGVVVGVGQLVTDALRWVGSCMPVQRAAGRSANLREAGRRGIGRFTVTALEDAAGFAAEAAAGRVGRGEAGRFAAVGGVLVDVG